MESTTTKNLLAQFNGCIKAALESPREVRTKMRAHSVPQRFPVQKWLIDLGTLQSKAISKHQSHASTLTDRSTRPKLHPEDAAADAEPKKQSDTGVGLACPAIPPSLVIREPSSPVQQPAKSLLLDCLSNLDGPRNTNCIDRSRLENAVMPAEVEVASSEANVDQQNSTTARSNIDPDTNVADTSRKNDNQYTSMFARPGNSKQG